MKGRSGRHLERCAPICIKSNWSFTSDENFGGLQRGGVRFAEIVRNSIQITDAVRPTHDALLASGEARHFRGVLREQLNKAFDQESSRLDRIASLYRTGGREQAIGRIDTDKFGQIRHPEEEIIGSVKEVGIDENKLKCHRGICVFQPPDQVVENQARSILSSRSGIGALRRGVGLAHAKPRTLENLNFGRKTAFKSSFDVRQLLSRKTRTGVEDSNAFGFQ